MEKIKAAAIKYKRLDNGKEDVVYGSSHASCISCFSIMDLYENMRDMNFEQQGFLTTEGRFVSRKEAYDIAEKAGQLSYKREDRILYSEFCNYCYD